MMGLGFPKSRTQFAEIVKSGVDRFPYKVQVKKIQTLQGNRWSCAIIGPVFSDATLNILSSKNRNNIEVRFSDVFPMLYQD